MMVRRQNIFLLTILTCLCITGCVGQEISPSSNTEMTVPEVIAPSPVRQEEERTPVCFSPRELLPFVFTPDSAGLMVRELNGVQLIDLQSGQEQAFFSSPKSIFSAALSPNGETLAWSLEGGPVQLVLVSNQRILHTLEGHTDTVYDLQFSPGGEFLFSASHDGWVRVWNVKKGTLLPSIQAGGEVLGIGVSPDGKTLATIPGDGPVQLWSLAEDKVIKNLGGTGGYDTSDAHFSPDGRYLATDLATGIFMWRISDGQLIWNEVKNSMAVAYSSDGQFLAFSNIDEDNIVTLASPDGAQIIRTIDDMQGPVWELFFAPNSKLLAATDGIEIHIWQVSDGKLLYIGKPDCS